MKRKLLASAVVIHAGACVFAIVSVGAGLPVGEASSHPARVKPRIAVQASSRAVAAEKARVSEKARIVREEKQEQLVLRSVEAPAAEEAAHPFEVQTAAGLFQVNALVRPN